MSTRNVRRRMVKIKKIIFVTVFLGSLSACQAIDTEAGEGLNELADLREEFMIGIFWAPPWAYTNDTHYDYLKDAHINFVPCYHPSLSPHPRSHKWPTDVEDTEERVAMQRRVLDLAHERGMKAAVKDPRIYDDVEAVVRDFQQHPGLGGYYLVDEPGRGAFEKYGQIYRDVLQHDPERIPLVNMLPSSPGRGGYYEFLNAWVDAAGPDNLTYLLFDNYPFACLGFEDSYYGRGRSHGHIPNYFQDLEVVRKVGLEHDIKTGIYLQSVGIERYLRRPDENDLRWNVYTALAYGIKNIQWFTWWTPTGGREPFTDAVIDPEGKKTDLYELVKNFNAQVKTLGPVLMTLDAVAVYHSGVVPEKMEKIPQDFFFKPADPDDAVVVSHMINQETGRQYVMVVNKDNRSLEYHAENLVLDGPKEIEFNVSGAITELGKISKESGEYIPTDEDLSEGVFLDSFLPGEGKLYVLPENF